MAFLPPASSVFRGTCHVLSVVFHGFIFTEAELPPVLAPPPLFYPTQHWTLTLRPPPPPPMSTPPGPPPPLQLWPAPVTLCSTGMISTSSSIVYNLPLLTVWEKTVLFLALLTSAQFCFVLFNWFALYLPCALCHFTLSISFLFFYFSTMSSFVYLYSLYVHMVKLYWSVFERLLSVFNVNCMHQGSESNAISILCMYVLWKNWQ